MSTINLNSPEQTWNTNHSKSYNDPQLEKSENKENEKQQVNTHSSKPGHLEKLKIPNIGNGMEDDLIMVDYGDNVNQFRVSESADDDEKVPKTNLILGERMDRIEKLEKLGKEDNLEKFKQLQKRISKEKLKEEEEFKIRDYDKAEDLELTKTFGKNLFSQKLSHKSSAASKNFTENSHSNANELLSSKASELSSKLLAKFQNQNSDLSIAKSISNSMSVKNNYITENLIKDNPSHIQLRSPSTIKEQKRSLGLCDLEGKNCFSGQLDVKKMAEMSSDNILSTFDAYSQEKYNLEDIEKNTLKKHIQELGQDQKKINKVSKMQNLQKASKKFSRQFSPLLKKSEDVQLSGSSLDKNSIGKLDDQKIVKSIQIDEIQDEDQKAIIQQFKAILISPKDLKRSSHSTQEELKKLKNFESDVLDPVDQLVSNMRTAEDCLDDGESTFDFKKQIVKMKLGKKVTKLDLDSINKSLEAVKNRGPKNLYGSITFYDDDLIQIAENQKNGLEENEEDANSENSFINYNTYDKYDEQK